MIEQPTVTKAIKALAPNAEFSYDTDGDGNWTITNWYSDDIDQPSNSDIEAKLTELQAEYDALAYARARALAYPSLSEFVEAYTEKEIGEDSTKWDAYVVKYNQVRTENPKG